MKNVLVCENLTAKYEGVTVIEDLSFSVSEGDYLCILGENGSGKSTLVKCLLGIKRPDKGGIIFGEGLSHSDIGYLPQYTNFRKDFPATVNEVVLSGCLGRRGFAPFYSAKEKDLALSVMKRLGIDGLASKSCRELSGGQQQKMLLARALCAARRMILLDEPVTGLDPSSAAEMYGIVGDLCEKDGMTVIMVSHDIKRSLSEASHILFLGSGDVFFGTTAEFEKSKFYGEFTGSGEVI